MQAVEGKPESGEHRSEQPSGLKKKIENSSKTFEKPLDKQKELCYNTKVADNKQRHHNSGELSGMKRKLKKLEKLFKNPLTSEKRCGIIIRLSHKATVR